MYALLSTLVDKCRRKKFYRKSGFDASSQKRKTFFFNITSFVMNIYVLEKISHHFSCTFVDICRQKKFCRKSGFDASTCSTFRNTLVHSHVLACGIASRAGQRSQKSLHGTQSGNLLLSVIQKRLHGTRHCTNVHVVQPDREAPAK